MSDTLDLTTVSDEPVESNVQVEITDAILNNLLQMLRNLL